MHETVQRTKHGKSSQSVKHHAFCLLGSVEKLFGHIVKAFLFLGVLDVQKDTELNIHRYFLIIECFAA